MSEEVGQDEQEVPAQSSVAQGILMTSVEKLSQEEVYQDIAERLKKVLSTEGGASEVALRSALFADDAP